MFETTSIHQVSDMIRPRLGLLFEVCVQHRYLVYGCFCYGRASSIIYRCTCMLLSWIVSSYVCSLW